MSYYLGVALLTYQRTSYALRTIRGILEHLTPRGDGLLWYVADDGSSPEHFNAVLAELRGAGAQIAGYHSERHSYGRSANKAWRALSERTNLTLWLEDDWELTTPFDVRPYMRALRENSDLGMVRLGYLSTGLSGRTVGYSGELYWQLDRTPHDTSIPVFAGHPSVRHSRYLDAYGPYPEGERPGETEMSYAYQFRMGSGPVIAWPCALGPWGVFAHIGEQKSEDL